MPHSLSLSAIPETTSGHPVLGFPPQPELMECLIPLDVSPTLTTAFPEVWTYMEAMKSLNFPKELYFSKAQKLAGEQLRQSIKVIPSSPPPRP